MKSKTRMWAEDDVKGKIEEVRACLTELEGWIASDPIALTNERTAGSCAEQLAGLVGALCKYVGALQTICIDEAVHRHVNQERDIKPSENGEAGYHPQTSPTKGVYFERGRNRWCAEISVAP